MGKFWSQGQLGAVRRVARRGRKPGHSRDGVRQPAHGCNGPARGLFRCDGGGFRRLTTYGGSRGGRAAFGMAATALPVRRAFGHSVPCPPAASMPVPRIVPHSV